MAYPNAEADATERLMREVTDYVADLVAKGDFIEFYEFSNDVNRRKRARGLPHREPVALIDMNLLTQ